MWIFGIHYFSNHTWCHFPALKELGVGFVAFSPLANGLLTQHYNAGSLFDPATDYRAVMPQFKPESYARNRELFALISRLAEEHHATSSQISLAWMLCKKSWIIPIPGTRHLSRLKENIGAPIFISQHRRCRT